MAKKADKALRKLKEAVESLEEQNEWLVETVERTSRDQAEALREIRALLEERLTSRDATPAERAQDSSPDGEAEEGPEATEAARRRAEELGVDVAHVAGTGSGGRVLVKDVEATAGGER